MFDMLTDSKPYVAVLGDLMLDHYMYCVAGGLTPEDHIAPKLKLVSEKFAPGGAANVALNLASLGCQVAVFGVCGMDENGNKLLAALEIKGINTSFVVFDSGRPTTTKQRIIVQTETKFGRKIVHPEGRYICRVDREENIPISADVEERLRFRMEKCQCAMFVVSDYSKGVVQSSLMESLAGRPYVVDPKCDDLNVYGKALCFTPNVVEYDNLQTSQHQGYATVVTRSGNGARVLYKDGVIDRTLQELMGFSVEARDCTNSVDVPVRYREHGDAIGCGDSLVAGLAFCLSTNYFTLKESIRFGVACGACSVDHEGAHAVRLGEVLEELKHREYRDED
jgi:D-beta-D-heptose 7-phosphate kinase/D-beta-D-heptose 1-phosphate adenosyltransferase